MLTMKEAVIQAKSYAKELFEDESIQDLSLEEIDFDNHSKKWKVTLGYNTERHKIERGVGLRPALAANAVSVFASNRKQSVEVEMVREYKVFEINAQNGSLIKMMIRPI